MSSLSGSLYLYLPIHHTHKHLPVLPTSCAALLLLLLLSSRCCCLLTSKIGLRPFRLFEIIKTKKKQNDQSRSCRLKFCLVIFVSAFFLVWFHISDGFTNYFVWFLFFIYLSILTIIEFHKPSSNSYIIPSIFSNTRRWSRLMLSSLSSVCLPVLFFSIFTEIRFILIILPFLLFPPVPTCPLNEILRQTFSYFSQSPVT